jgi:pyrimidine-nucleoside phosphorylase
LDKLEAIPGFRVNLSMEECRAVLRDVGCAIVSPSATLVPADRRLYALRDVTGSVESIPLIAASMMSKAIASGDGAFLIDLKYGDGSLLKQRISAEALATEIEAVGNLLSIAADVELSLVSQPVGSAIGNSLEIAECIQVLSGGGTPDLRMQAVSLAARMLCLASVCATREAAEALASEAINSGAALQTFRRMIEAQGGDARIVDDRSRLPQAPRRFSVLARQSGSVTALDAMRLGLAALMLGAGRERLDHMIDHAVGVLLHRRVGDQVQAGDPLAEAHYRDDEQLEAAVAYIDSAFTIQRATDRDQTFRSSA